MISSLSRHQYPELLQSLSDCSVPDFQHSMRELCRTDLWFLLRYVLRREDMETQVANPDWLLARCREIQANPDGYLDLWAREHYKSTIITFGLTIQTILRSYGDDPIDRDIEPTIGLFSHTRPIAKSFLRQIRTELAYNASLKEWFPDILYANPERDAPRWSDESMIIRRRSNPKEGTMEAWGLVDGQPTGMHYSLLIYDDVVTLGSVSNPEQIAKTTEAWEMSRNLGAGETARTRMIGTRYHYNDTWGQLLKRGAAIPRIYPATEEGSVDGAPVLRSRPFLAQRYREMGQYVFSSQMLQNPVADSTQGFRREWMRYYDTPDQNKHMNRYLLVDPASSKKAGSDWTAMAVWGLGPDDNLYLIDVLRDRLNLTERARALMQMHRKHRPKAVGYERYGMQADIEYIRKMQAEDNYRFEITEVGGQVSKVDRIRRLIPYFESGRVYLPTTLTRTLYDKSTVDLINVLVEEELMGFPVALHDDLSDAMARLFDLDPVWPKLVDAEKKPDRYTTGRRTSWMAR